MELDQLWAYCGRRAASRSSTKGVRVHAVGLFAKLSGAMDAECGEIGVVPVGVWDPGVAHACPDCVAILAADREPVAPEPAPAPVPVSLPRPRRRHRRRVVVSADQLDVLAEVSAA